MANLYVIAGCNGAGKTTTSYTVLPEMLSCREFVNADEIARGLSPFQPESVSFHAGRIMINRIIELIRIKADFGFETTLASKGHRKIIQHAKRAGYSVVLIYFWLESIELAKARVRKRVENGGHNIPPEVIERRYLRGLRNFFSWYQALSDRWVFYNNSGQIPTLVAKGKTTLVEVVYNSELWSRIIKGNEDN
jgi:predicted ABC-type ATPase